MDEGKASERNQLIELINLTSNYMKSLKKYTDPERTTPEQRKPIIDAIRKMEKNIQKFIDEIRELDEQI